MSQSHGIEPLPPELIHEPLNWLFAEHYRHRQLCQLIERVGNATTVCDLSGRGLPNLPKFVWTASAEYKTRLSAGTLSGEAYARGDFSARTRVFGDPTASRFTVIGGHRLVNATLGVRTDRAWDASLWVRNIFGENYLQNVTVQAGNSGLVVGTPGDPRTYGITLRGTY